MFRSFFALAKKSLNNFILLTQNKIDFLPLFSKRKKQMTSYFVSAELSSFLGVNVTETIPRHEIEHKILSYAKDKNLVSQQNPMVIHTDEVLETLMNGKEVFNGFSIIPNLKHHLVAFADSDTISEQGDQMNSNFPEEETSEESNEEEETQEVTVKRVVLCDPSGNEFTFESSSYDNIRIQRTFVMSNEEFRELTNSLVEPHYTMNKEDNPYETITFLIMFLITFLSLSLWLSILNNGLEKMAR